MRLNVFQKAVNTIFQCEDFLETCTIENVVFKCIASSLSTDDGYTVAGLVDECDFTLDLQLPLPKPVKPEDRVTFRGKEYRIAFITVDSAPASVKLRLRDPSNPRR